MCIAPLARCGGRMNLKTFAVPSSRRKVCYGPVRGEESISKDTLVPLSLTPLGISSSHATLSEKKLYGFLHSCHEMRLLRQERELRRLQQLKLIYRRFEMITLFKSWYQYVLCRRIHRRHTLLNHWRKWWKCYLFRKYSILLTLSSRTKPLLRHALQVWWKATLHLRAWAFYRRNLLMRMMQQWKLLLENSAKRLLAQCFSRWKLYLLLMKKLRKLVYRSSCNLMFLGPPLPNLAKESISPLENSHLSYCGHLSSLGKDPNEDLRVCLLLSLESI